MTAKAITALTTMVRLAMIAPCARTAFAHPYLLLGPRPGHQRLRLTLREEPAPPGQLLRRQGGRQ
jgi:hypothetical protein